MSSHLILSGSIGSGHDAVAAACSEVLVRAGWTTETVDCMAALGGIGSSLGAGAFRALFALPPVYDAFHFGVLRNGGPLAELFARQAADRLWTRLEDRWSSPDLVGVIAVFATGAGVLSRMREARPDLRTAVVLPDACAHRLWVSEGVDRYLVSSELGAATVRRYDPEANVAVAGPPVREQFYEAPLRSAARVELGLSVDARVALVMCGTWNRTPVEDIADRLARSGLEALVLGERRTSARTSHPRTHVLGRRDDVATVMAASDVVITTPGQVCNEARAVGRPLVVLDAVAGHGRENFLAELARGGACGAPATPEGIERAVRLALNSPPVPPNPPDWRSALLEAVTPFDGVARSR